MSVNVVILQPHVPAYRRPLFDALNDLITADGGELRVLHGTPPADMAARGDAIEAPWSAQVPSLNLPGKLSAVQWRRYLASRSHWTLVTELSAYNLNAWQAIRGHQHDRVILWGHGKSYVSPERPLSSKLKVELAKRADGVWTYTESGRAWLADRGVSVDKITAVGNASDNRAIYDSIIDRPELRNPDPHTALFIGSLDVSKNLEFLAAAADEAHKLNPRFRLIVAGSGPDVHRLEGRSHVELVGRVGTADKVRYGREASAIWCPGRIGLVALDALALALPVVATRFEFNAPETDYLVADVNWFRLDEIPESYARGALQIMGNSASSPLAPIPGPSCLDVTRRMLMGLSS